MLLVYFGFDTFIWKPKRDQANAAAQIESVEESTDAQDAPPKSLHLFLFQKAG